MHQKQILIVALAVLVLAWGRRTPPALPLNMEQSRDAVTAGPGITPGRVPGAPKSLLAKGVRARRTPAGAETVAFVP